MSFIFFFLIFIKFYFVFSTYFSLSLDEKEIYNDIIKLTILDRNNSVYIFTQSNFYIIRQNNISPFTIHIGI